MKRIFFEEELEEDVELEEEYIEEEAEATDEGMSYDEDDKVDEVTYTIYKQLRNGGNNVYRRELET